MKSLWVKLPHFKKMKRGIMKENKVSEEYKVLYKNTIAQAKKVFGKHFTCKLGIAPDKEEFEVARLPLRDSGGKFDSVQVCLIAFPAVFLTAYMLDGNKKVMSIGTRSGAVKELWDMVRPIIELEANGEIGIDLLLNSIQTDLLSSFLIGHWKEISKSEHKVAFERILEKLNPGALRAVFGEGGG